MLRQIRIAAIATLAALPMVAAAAAPTITDEEEHVLRGFFDRQSNAAALARVALERGSTDDLKKFAQSELDMYRKFADEVVRLDDLFLLNTRPLAPGVTSPPLSQGVSRGVDPLPEGWRKASRNVAGFLNAGGGMPGMPPAGAAPSQGMAPSGAPPARPAGPAMIRYDYDIAALKQLSGAEFDKQYLLRVAIAHNAMLRHVSNELNEEGAHPEMVTFAKAVLKTIAAQNSSIERLLTGQSLVPAPRAGGPAAQPAGPAAGAPPRG